MWLKVNGWGLATGLKELFCSIYSVEHTGEVDALSKNLPCILYNKHQREEVTKQTYYDIDVHANNTVDSYAILLLQLLHTWFVKKNFT